MNKRSTENKEEQQNNTKDNEQRRIHMATQIAATPTLKGEQVKHIMEQLKNEPSEKAKLGARKIMEMFEKKK